MTNTLKVTCTCCCQYHPVSRVIDIDAFIHCLYNKPRLLLGCVSEIPHGDHHMVTMVTMVAMVTI